MSSSSIAEKSTGGKTDDLKVNGKANGADFDKKVKSEQSKSAPQKKNDVDGPKDYNKTEIKTDTNSLTSQSKTQDIPDKKQAADSVGNKGAKPASNPFTKMAETYSNIFTLDNIKRYTSQAASEAKQEVSAHKAESQRTDLERVKKWSEGHISTYDKNGEKVIHSSGSQKVYDALAGKSDLGQLTKNEKVHLVETAARAWATGPKDFLSSRNGDIHKNSQKLAELVKNDKELRDIVVDTYTKEASGFLDEKVKLLNAEHDNTGAATLAIKALELDTNRALPQLEGAEKALAYDLYQRGKAGGVMKRLASAEPSQANDKLTTQLFLQSGKRNDMYNVYNRAALADALVHNWTKGAKDASSDALKKQLHGVLQSQGGQELLLNDKVAPQQRMQALTKVMSDPSLTADKLKGGWESDAIVQAFGKDQFQNFAAMRGHTDAESPQGKNLQNLVGTALSQKVQVPENETEAQKLQREAATAEGKVDYFQNNKQVQTIAGKIRELGGDQAKVTVVPVVHSSNKLGVIQVPLFRVEGQNGQPPRFVDNLGRTYKDQQDWEKNNQLPNHGKITFPKNMDLKDLEPAKPIDAQTFGEKVREIGDYAALAGGVVAGAAIVVGTGGLGAVAVAGVASAWTVGGAASDLHDMHTHGQNIGDLSDPTVRGKWFDVAAGGLSLGAMKAGVLASRLKAGQNVSKAVSGLHIAANTVDVAAFADTGQQLARNWDKMSAGERTQASLQMMFWGGMMAGTSRSVGAKIQDSFNFNRINNYIQHNAAVPVKTNADIKGDSLRVAYDRNPDGQLSNVRIEHNPNHKPSKEDLKLHSDVARLVESTGGLSDRLSHYFKGETALKPGSVGWEARHEINKLGGKIDNLTSRLAKGNLSQSDRTRIEGEISSLKSDIDRYRGVVNEADRYGRGYVAQDSTATALAKERGYPTGDDMPAYHYWNSRTTTDPVTGEQKTTLFPQRTDATKIDLHKFNETTGKFERIPGTKEEISTSAARKAAQVDHAGNPEEVLYKSRTEALDASNGQMSSVEAYANKQVTGSPYKFAEDPNNFIPKRAELHNKLLVEEMEAAKRIAQNQTGEPTLYAMRGNTGSGKTRAVQGKEGLQNLPIVNPDRFKHRLMEETDAKVTHGQVHVEGAILSQRFRNNLLRPDSGVKSFMVDGRLGDLKQVKELADLARVTGRKLQVVDVDAPLENSLIGVLQRKPGGADPIVGFDVVADNGFVPARANRKAIIKMFEKNPSLGKYELYGTRPNGEKYLAAKVENGEIKTFIDDGDLNILTSKNYAKENLAELKSRKLDDAEINRVTKDLPEGEWKNSVIETLKKYKDLTWEEAITKHNQF